MPLDDAGDDVSEVGLRLDADELTGLDQRGDRRPVLAAAVRAVFIVLWSLLLRMIGNRAWRPEPV
jgi:hypothetical protein